MASAAGALGTVLPIANTATKVTIIDLINLDLNTDFPRIQIKEVGLYPISKRELMPKGAPSQSSCEQIAEEFKVLPK